MIEKTILDYLASALDVPVYTERPEEVPQSWVRIEKTDGSCTCSGIIYRSFLTVQSCAATMYEAAVLNETVKALMLASEDALEDVIRCDLDGEYNHTETTLKEYRYEAVYDLTHL